MKWFKKTEFIRCYRQEKGQRCKECRLPQPATRLPNGIEENMMALAEEVLEPARTAFGRPVVVNSGFRCPLHNQTVGGAFQSQHVSGQAADICAERGKYGSVEEWKKANLELARVIVKNGKWDQMILYPTFIHVSYKKNGRNRKEVLRKTARGYEKVEPSNI